MSGALLPVYYIKKMDTMDKCNAIIDKFHYEFNNKTKLMINTVKKNTYILKDKKNYILI